MDSEEASSRIRTSPSSSSSPLSLPPLFASFYCLFCFAAFPELFHVPVDIDLHLTIVMLGTHKKFFFVQPSGLN